MINIDKLKAVTKIIVHKYCHDGTSSAMIIKDVLHNAVVLFCGHKDKEYLELKAEPGLLFCDIAPPPCVCGWNNDSKDPQPECCKNRDQEFLDAESIVLDHHIKRFDLISKFINIGLGVYGENSEGTSGAVLAYEYVWKPLQESAKTEKFHVCRLARLAGIRDTFQMDSIEWDDAQEQTEALAFFPSEHYINNHICGILPEEKYIGAVICERNKSILNRVIESPFILPWNNLKIAIISGHRIISDAAGAFTKKNIPITFAFTFKVSEYGTPLMSLSARSNGSFDCNKFAGNFKGGGHIEAAGGMIFEIKDNTLNPYSLLKDALEKYGYECLIC